MQIIDRKLNGLVVIENKRFADDRGFFEEFFHEQKSAEAGLPLQFVQVNHSRSVKNVVRGLHYQVSPAQGKLVGVIKGLIWDVAVDLRLDSPTRGQHFGLELSEDNGRMLWIPAGFAHGFCVLSETPADVMYLVDHPYNARTEGGICWDDSTLNIPWPVRGRAIVSERDQKQMTWPQFVALQPPPF